MPATIPVATPVKDPIVAMEVLLLLHTPDGVVQASAVVPPLHTLSVPVIGATAMPALTFTVWVVVPVPHTFTTVYVMVTTPVARPVTTPNELTVASAGLLLLQVPPVVASARVIVWPIQTALAPVIVPADAELTVTVTADEVATHGPDATITV